MRPLLVLCFWKDHIMLSPPPSSPLSLPQKETANSAVCTHPGCGLGLARLLPLCHCVLIRGWWPQHNKTIDCRCGRSVLIESHRGGGAGSAINEMMRVAGAAWLLGFSFQPVGPWPFVPHDACGPGEL